VKPLKLTLVLQLLLVFLSGSVVGALGYRLYSRGTAAAELLARSPRPAGFDPARARNRWIEALRTRLKLSADQVQKLNAIFDATHHRFGEARKKAEAETRKTMDPEMDAIHKDQVAQIEAMLDAGQVAEYRKMLEERRKIMENRSHNPRPDGDRDRRPPPGPRP
jgi:Spy/CpxP family protein refolding chaperone